MCEALSSTLSIAKKRKRGKEGGRERGREGGGKERNLV
jgi:hypothetical protein